MGDQIGNLLGSVLGGAQTLGSDVLGGLGSVGSAIGSGVGSIANTLGSGLSGLFGGGAGAATGDAANALSSASPAFASAGGAGSAGSSILSSALGAPSGGVTAASAAGSLPNDLGWSGNPTADLTNGGVSPVAPMNVSGPIDTTSPISMSGINGAIPSPLIQALSSTGAGGAGGGFSGGNLMKLLPALLLGGSLIRGQGQPQGLSQLEALAQQEGGIAGGILPGATSELQGNLPGGAEQSIQSALQDANTATSSRYAQLGLAGSTMEQQDKERNAQNAQAQAWQLAQELATQGFNIASGASGMEQSIYQAIMSESQQQSNEFSQALAQFAGALALGTKT